MLHFSGVLGEREIRKGVEDLVFSRNINSQGGATFPWRKWVTTQHLMAPLAGRLPSPSSARSMALIHVVYTSSSASPFPLLPRPHLWRSLLRPVPQPLWDASFEDSSAKESDVESSVFSLSARPSIFDCSSTAFEDSQVVTSLIPVRLVFCQVRIYVRLKRWIAATWSWITLISEWPSLAVWETWTNLVGWGICAQFWLELLIY